jgi:hypothetical protein
MSEILSCCFDSNKFIVLITMSMILSGSRVLKIIVLLLDVYIDRTIKQQVYNEFSSENILPCEKSGNKME